MIRLLVWAALCAGAGLANGRELIPDAVIESVRSHYPPLLAALLDQDIADADLLSSKGRFDPVLRARTDSDSFGFYSNQRADVWMEQPLAWQGMSLQSGYRLSSGDLAPYDGKFGTRSLGEFRTGMRMPLFRDRTVDSRRAELGKARAGQRIARLSVDQQRLVVVSAALLRYWLWVAAGQRLAVTRDVLRAAESRHLLLEEGVRQGQLPAIEAVDNQRAILQRRSALVEAERAFQQAAIELSLFLRDGNGTPRIPSVGEVPARFPEPGSKPGAFLAGAERQAIEQRPEIARVDALADQAAIDLRMARNAAKPAVDLTAGFTAEGGSNPAVRRGPQELRAGVAFEFPWRNRVARGREAAASARLKQIQTRSEFARDQITAEVRDATVWIETAIERVRLLADEVRVSRDLEAAERARFEIGEGTLFILNLREQATLDAAIREALAQADYQRAIVAHESATGELLLRIR